MSSGCGAWQITLQAPNAKAKSIWPKMAAPQYGLLYCSLASVAQDGPGWPGVRDGKIYRKPWFLPSNIGLSCKFSHHPILWQSALICFDQLFEMIRWSLRTSQVDFILPGRLTQLTPQNLHAQLFYFARMGMDQRRLHHDPGTLFIPNPSDFLCLPGYFGVYQDTKLGFDTVCHIKNHLPDVYVNGVPIKTSILRWSSIAMFDDTGG